MTDSFGGQSVGVVTVSRGAPGYLGLALESRSTVTVTDCHFRPAGSSETPEGVNDVATEIWKLTAPPVAAVLNAHAGDEVTYGDMVFQVVGPVMPKYDGANTVHHVTVMVKRQTAASDDDGS